METAHRSFGAVAALLAIGVFLCGWDFSLAAEPPPPAVPPAAAPAGKPVGAAPSDANATTVKITFITVPSKPAMVFWGKKRLGVIAPHQPLVVQRPRDSGPLDVIVRSQGYLPVQTRAYTFGDSKVAVKLTPPDQKNTLLGYREAPPEEPAVPPAGAVPPVAAPGGVGAPDGGAGQALTAVPLNLRK
jgi:hypothetical protein